MPQECPGWRLGPTIKRVGDLVHDTERPHARAVAMPRAPRPREPRVIKHAERAGEQQAPGFIAGPVRRLSDQESPRPLVDPRRQPSDEFAVSVATIDRLVGVFDTGPRHERQEIPPGGHERAAVPHGGRLRTIAIACEMGLERYHGGGSRIVRLERHIERASPVFA